MLRTFKLSSRVFDEVMGIKDGGEEMTLRLGRNDYRDLKEA